MSFANHERHGYAYSIVAVKIILGSLMTHGNIFTLALVALISACQASSSSAQSHKDDGSASNGVQPSAQTQSAEVQSASTSPAQGQQSQSTSVTRGDATLCTSDERVLFSCKIKGSGKLASMCASKDVAEASGHLYYTYGTPQRTELVFPAKKQPPAKLFKRTHLGFAGNTGGYAYSFENEGFKYIVYSISGASGHGGQGITVIGGDARKLETMYCQQDSVIEDGDNALLDLTLSWDRDPVIESQGLPTKD